MILNHISDTLPHYMFHSFSFGVAPSKFSVLVDESNSEVNRVPNIPPEQSKKFSTFLR